MSESRNLPVGDEQPAAEHNHCQNKPDNFQSRSVWLGPLTTAEFLLTKICKRETGGKEKSGYVAPIVGFFHDTVFPLLIFTAIVGCIGAAAFYFGFSKPEHVIVACTFVIATFAGVQWWSTNRQWQTARDQNEIMTEQMCQTDTMIEEMRLDRRAWLSIANVKIRPIEDGITVHCTLTFSNTGKTPAKIIEGRTFLTVRDENFDRDTLVDEFEKMSQTERDSFVIPPGQGRCPACS